MLIVWFDSIAWNNPGILPPPPVHWFEDDAHLGIYSVQFTATDSYAWPGIEGTKKCEGFEGICHPLYIFHRRGYDIVLKTWGKSFLLGI